MLAIDKAFELSGVDNAVVAQEHAKIIMQDDDLGNKLWAINSYHKIKGNNAATKTEAKSVSFNVDISDEQFKEFMADLSEWV